MFFGPDLAVVCAGHALSACESKSADNNTLQTLTRLHAAKRRTQVRASYYTCVAEVGVFTRL
jgi:hypothetical protein